MIFGNPGICLGDGSYDDFSIVIENLTGKFYSVNFCVDLGLFPTHLAYNSKHTIFNAFRAKNIFRTQSKELFGLDNRALMIALIKESFTTLYKIEEIIDLDLQPKVYTDSEINEYESLFESVAYLDENQDRLWDIDWMEYSNRGFHVFIVNYQDETKVVLVQLKFNCAQDFKYERYFYKDKNPKQVSFFDENYWSVKVAKIPTEKLLSINSQILDKFLY